ncbi:hypothetical protein BJX64DRAFT_262642 [Aspergillus heterothallicus]
MISEVDCLLIDQKINCRADSCANKQTEKRQNPTRSQFKILQAIPDIHRRSKMSTVSITSDLEPYLDSLRLYLANDNPDTTQAGRQPGSPSKSKASRPAGPAAQNKKMGSRGETNGDAEVQASAPP